MADGSARIHKWVAQLHCVAKLLWVHKCDFGRLRRSCFAVSNCVRLLAAKTSEQFEAIPCVGRTCIGPSRRRFTRTACFRFGQQSQLAKWSIWKLSQATVTKCARSLVHCEDGRIAGRLSLRLRHSYTSHAVATVSLVETNRTQCAANPVGNWCVRFSPALSSNDA